MVYKYGNDASGFLGIGKPFRGNVSDYSENIAKTFLMAENGYTPSQVYFKAYQFFKDKFFEINNKYLTEDEDEVDREMIAFLTSLKFVPDDKYRVDKNVKGRGWQSNFFLQELPQYLVPYLIEKKFLFVKDAPSNEVLYRRECTRPLLK